MLGNLNLANNKITNLAAGTATTDAATWAQLFGASTQADIASAATADIGVQNTSFLRVTGTTTITSFGSSFRGPRFLTFEGAVTLTHSSTLVLPGGADITTAAGDSLIVIPGATLGTADKWIVVAYQAATGFLKANNPSYTGTLTGGTINSAANPLILQTGGTERARIDSSGHLLVGKTSTDATVAGCVLSVDGAALTRGGATPLTANRETDDGTVISIRQAGVQEGVITVSGTTVSYLGGHLSRWAQTTTAKDESLVKGTVLSNLDAMNVYVDSDGNPVENEQLNKVKVSDVEGDANVAGVFVNWDYDEAHNVDEINMAMTGDMIIRIAQGVTVARGDLLMSAGDGTAKPQGDDIVRSKTIAKVTSTHVTCTYADGSFCVPCVLMAC
jgi:hypothetical protein